MRTLNLLSAVAVLSLLSGCVDESPWRIIQLATDLKCSGTAATAGQTSGLLDISAATRQQSNYILQIGDLNEASAPKNMNANLMDLSKETSDSIAVKELIVSYTSTPRIDMKKEAIPIGGIVPTNAGNGSFIETNIITQNAAEALLNAVAQGNTAELVVTLQLHGTLDSGGDIFSTTATYPIHVFNSGATCPAPDQFGPSGACGGAGGQDGTPPCCASDSMCVPPM